LLISCLGLSLAGHLGASITHGEDYVSSAFPWNQRAPVEPELVQAFKSFAAADSFPPDQLDRLGLEVRATFAHSCYKCHNATK